MREKTIMSSRITLLIIIIVSLSMFSGCSIKKFAMNQVANALASPEGGTVFTGDDDPELVGDALPFAIKMYESLLAAVPNNRPLLLRTGSLYVMYANAFLYTPATMLTDMQYKEQEHLFARAKNLYLRGRDMLLDALEKKHKGFRAALEKKDYDTALKSMKLEDVPFLYWAGAGWLGAFAIDPFDMDLGVSMPKAAALMGKVRELDPKFDNGAIHDFYILYYGSLPDYMGGDLGKARKHYEKAIEITGGKLTSPYISLATSVCEKEQNVEEFKQMLEKVLAIDPDADIANRLVNTINQRKAKWLLEHLDDFFLLEEPNLSKDDGFDNTQEGIK